MDNWEKPQKDTKKIENDLQKIHWRIDQWFPDLSSEQKVQLKQFHDELQKFNRTLNLVSPKTIPHSDAIHFADSILACRIIYNSNKVNELYDFGSGNGFPGIIFSILYPDTKIHLVDVDQRKSEFLKHMVSFLKLKNIDVLNVAIESFPEKSIKIAISRGYASIAKSILSTRKLFERGGKYYHFKGEEWASEVAAIPTQLCSFWTPSLVGEYKLPVGDFKFAVVKTEKIAD